MTESAVRANREGELENDRLQKIEQDLFDLRRMLAKPPSYLIDFEAARAHRDRFIQAGEPCFVLFAERIPSALRTQADGRSHKVYACNIGALATQAEFSPFAGSAHGGTLNFNPFEAGRIAALPDLHGERIRVVFTDSNGRLGNAYFTAQTDGGLTTYVPNGKSPADYEREIFWANLCRLKEREGKIG